MNARAIPANSGETLSLRARQRAELNCQIVHDSIHTRAGWTRSYLLELDGTAVGFGSIAIAGPWKDKPTVYEFYLLPPWRSQAFALFETLLETSGARFFEIQSNDALLLAVTLAYARDIATESIVFEDRLITTLPANGAVLNGMTDLEEIRASQERRQGGGEWQVQVEASVAAKGGILFHYNRPYGDIYMEVNESFRRRGIGSYLVQELKRECYRLGALPGARCHPTNVASRRTLQKAGFVPYAHILNGALGNATRNS